MLYYCGFVVKAFSKTITVLVCTSEKMDLVFISDVKEVAKRLLRNKRDNGVKVLEFLHRYWADFKRVRVCHLQALRGSSLIIGGLVAW